VELLETEMLGGPVEEHGLKEDAKTLSLMRKYGIENVRGGSFSSIVLDANTLGSIRRQLNHTEGNCLQCGANDHWAKDCEQTVLDCIRCGRNNHTDEDCFATFHIDGYVIEDWGSSPSSSEEDEETEYSSEDDEFDSEFEED